MRILFTSPVLEHPAAGGSQLRVENSIKALARVCELDIISRSPPSMAGGAVAESFYRHYCTEFHVMPGVQNLSANRYIRKLQKTITGIGGRSVNAAADFLLQHCERRNIGMIWFGYGNISYPLIQRIRHLRPEIKLICDTDSVWSRFILRRLPYVKGLRKLYTRWLGARKEAEEKAWVNLCDITTAVSAFDAEYYRSLAKEPERVRVFSNVIDLDTYATAPAAAPGLKHPSIYLAGVFGHYYSPMDTAARWLLEEVMPHIRSRMPGVHLYLVGKESDRMFGHLNGPDITVTGKLPSVLPYLCHVDVALVPLHFESGTRYKILEAGACRVPLVSTTLGAEGLPVKHEEHLLIADTPEDFAAATLRLLKDKNLASRLTENCYKLVAAQYSIDTLEAEAREILRAIA